MGEAERELRRLLDIMAALRAPVGGCAWDVQQDFDSIAPYTIEEAYEVADAIARGDLVDLKEELGDLLLQVVYHAQLAREQGAFAFADVVHAITTKMIRRHPHVFGDAQARNAGAAQGWWETIKEARTVFSPKGRSMKWRSRSRFTWVPRKSLSGNFGSSFKRTRSTTSAVNRGRIRALSGRTTNR